MAVAELYFHPVEIFLKIKKIVQWFVFLFDCLVCFLFAICIYSNIRIWWPNLKDFSLNTFFFNENLRFPVQ